LYGPKAQGRLEGHSLYPESPEPDERSEWLFLAPGGPATFARSDSIGVGNDKTTMNHTWDISERIPEYYEEGRFMSPRWFQTFVRVVNKSALVQWDMWFTVLEDMVAIKMYPFDPSIGGGLSVSEKAYPVIAYAAGELDVEAQGGEDHTFSLLNPEYTDPDYDPETDAPIADGINRIVLQAASVRRDRLRIDVGWSDMVYRADSLSAENLAQLTNETRRATDLTPAELAAGPPYRLADENDHKFTAIHYGLNASGKVRFYPAGTDPNPEFAEFATYRIPVRQAMWRGEASGGAQHIQSWRGWSYNEKSPIEIPEVRYGLPPWSESQAGVGKKLLGLPFVADYILGTDLLGHDILTGLILGARVSLYIGFLATFIATTIGVTLGAISGYYAGLVDEFFMRFTDIIISIPSFFLLLLALSVFQDSIRDLGAYGGPTIIALILGFLGWATTTRIVRAEFLALRGLEYAEAARVLGASDRRIIFRHLLPNAMAPVIVNATIGIAFIILIEAGIAFLGLGNPQTPSWGRMLQLAQAGMRFAWWAAIIPGIAIFIAVLAFNMLGDALRDALDPRLKE
ncbi:MAG: ABC transporter permease, partial [Candidatus Hodarchaeales archaeon]